MPSPSRTTPPLRAEHWPDGFDYYPDYFTKSEQESLINAVSQAVRGDTPFYRPTMPRTGQPLSVVMSNFGALGWVTDKTKGYRYERVHPKTQKAWLPIPSLLLTRWDALTGLDFRPEACLINWYAGQSKMGLHVDNDEQAVGAPILSVSLGDQALFRLGGLRRNDPTTSFKLSSGDVVVMAGKSRQCYHGVDRIYAGTSSLVPRGGRINLTLRRVMPVGVALEPL